MDNNNRKTQAIQPHKAPLSKAELKRLQWEKERRKYLYFIYSL